MEYPMALFLTIILLTFATDHICGQMIKASQNPLPVDSNVTLSLSNQTTIGTWSFESDNIVLIYPVGVFKYPNWKDRITFNRTAAELSIRSLQVSDSGLYKLSSGMPSFDANITLSVQELITNVTLRANEANLIEFNDSVVFTCSVSSGSSLSYQWHTLPSFLPLNTSSDRFQFSSGGTVLTIANVTRYDQGPFRCQVTNGVSNGSSADILLNISYGPSDPKIVISPMMPAYKTGSNITLCCQADSKPTATIVHWFLNEMDLGLVGPEIQLQHTNKNQTGYYKCVLHNTVTNRYNSVKTMITIMDPISSFAVSRVGGPAILGQSVTLSCDVSGSVESILWWKNGATMTYNATSHNMTYNMTNKSLTLDPVMHSDAGNYQCQAFNFVSNKTSSPYRLIVNYGPETPVITGPSSALAGQQVTFNCSASSQPPSQYSWYFNHVPVSGASQYVTGPLTMDLSGKYICMAFNNITGRNTTAYTMLTVYDPITHVQVEDPSTPPIQGLSFTLECNATGTVHHVYWMKNGEMLYADNTTTLSMYNTTLTFNPVHKEDSGYYKCIAANVMHNMTSPTYGLHVNFGPYTPMIMGQHIAEIGEHVVFNCSASSYPPSHYQWYFKGIRIGNGSMFETGPLSLNMNGEYTCMATNNVTKKNSTSFTLLTVIEGVEDVAIKEDSLPIQSYNFTLSCEVAAPYDSMYWMKDGIELGSFNESTNDSHVSYYMKNNSLHFSPVTTNDNGIYQCIAVNVIGQHSSPEYKLLVNYGPLKVHIDGPDVVLTGLVVSVSFTCSADSRPTSQYQWFMNSVPEIVETGSQLTIWAITPKVLNYTCKAYNNVTKISMYQSKTLTINDAPSHSLASPGVLLFMTLSALSVPMLGDSLFN